MNGHLGNVRRAEDGGCAAIVMHSLFEEQIAEPAAGRIPGFEQAARAFVAAQEHFSRPEKFPLGPEEYLEQLRRIKAAVSVSVIGSLNSLGTDGWITCARLIEEAGAHSLELNVYYLSTGVGDSSVDIETRIESLVRTLKGLIRIPIAVKLSPFFTAFGSLAMRSKPPGLMAWFCSIASVSPTSTSTRSKLCPICICPRARSSCYGYASWRFLRSTSRPRSP